MAEIKISTQDLSNLAAEIGRINLDMDSKLSDINKKMNDLEVFYKSDAAMEIRANMNALRPRFEEYKRVVESYAEYLRKSAEKYRNIEIVLTNNASAFK